MAGFAWKPLFQVVGTTAAVQAYKSPVATDTEVMRIIVCNTTADVQTFTIYHDIDGDVYGDASAIVAGMACKPGEVIKLELFCEMLPDLGSLAVKASANSSLTFTGYGWQNS